MISNELNVAKGFAMRVNFNLKRIGGQKSQIWLSTTINRERVRIYTGLLIESQYWVKASRTEIGGQAMVGGALGQHRDKLNHDINKRLKQILGYCKEYGVMVSQSHLLAESVEFSKSTFESFLKSKIRGVETNVRKNPKAFIEAYIKRKSQMTNKDTLRRIVSGTIYMWFNVFS